MLYILLLGLFTVVMLMYFRVADHFNIIDKPNERSSHSQLTIRGGGVIFLVAAIMITILYPEYWLPVIGLLIIGVVSFLDDIVTLSSKIRLVFHLIAVSIAFCYLNIYGNESAVTVMLLYVMTIGIINMYNFMDGINGINGAYSLVILSGLQYVNIYKSHFISVDIIWFPILACLVFLFFNFRKKAKCFAGDVGSVTISFWIIILLLKLIMQTHNWIFILFLAVYGVDSVMTIGHRLILKQNIFKAHRLHFYQLLANEAKIPHLAISCSYAFVQLVIIVAIIYNNIISSDLLAVIIILPLILIYITAKPMLLKKVKSTSVW